MDLEACGVDLTKGGICTRKGSKPDGRCHQHCAPEYRPTKKESSNEQRQQTLSQRQREFEDNLVQRIRSTFINNLRESEERLSKKIDELKVQIGVQDRLLSLYEKIIQEKVSPQELKSYLEPQIPTGEELDAYIRSVALEEAGLTEEECDRVLEKKVEVNPLALVLVREEDDEDEPELSFEEKERLYAQLSSESMQHSGDGVLPQGFMERYKLLFPKERRKRLFTESKLIPPSQERDEELLALYQKKKDKGLISKIPPLEEIPGSTKYKPYVEKSDEEEEKEEKDLNEWEEKFTFSAIEGQSTPCVHCKVGLAPPDRVSCNECYVKLWRCKALNSKGEPCSSFASQYGPYCKRHIGYQAKK